MKSDATRVKRDTDAVSGATDSEDAKEPNASPASGVAAVGTTTEANDAAAGSEDDDDAGADAKEGGAQTEDDDALTSMSLNEDLEIFDGLKFEGGGVIDVASARAPPHRAASDGDDGEGDVDADTDGAETVRPDDEEDEEEEEMGEMYDDDDDETGDAPDVQDGAIDGESLDEPSSAMAFADPDPMLGDVLSFGENVSGDFSLDM